MDTTPSHQRDLDGASIPPPVLHPDAVMSLIFGALWLAGVGSVLAIVRSRRARRQIAARPTEFTGARIADAGLLLGVFGILFTVFLVGAFVFMGIIGQDISGSLSEAS